MSSPKFRKPEEMDANESRTPVSARLKASTKKALEEAAKKNGLSLGLLIANVLDDYAEWLSQAKPGKKG